MTIAILMLAFTVLSIVLGLVIGMIRGRNRSILRLVLVVISVILAFCFRAPVANAIMNVDAGDGMTLVQSLTAEFSGGMEFWGDVVVSIVTAYLSAIAFAVCYAALLIVTGLILYPIGKIFVRKPKEGESKHVFAGGIVGLIGGVIVAYFLCAPLTCGLNTVAQVYDVIQELDTSSSTSAAYDDGSTAYAEEVPPTDDGSDTGSGAEDGTSTTAMPEFVQSVYNYSNTGIGKFYNTVGTPIFNLIASSTSSDGSKTTLNGQLEGIKATVSIARLAEKLKNYKPEGKLTKDDIAQIKSVLQEMDDAKEGLSDEGKQTVNKILNGVKDAFGDEAKVDLSKIDMTNVSFVDEAQTLEDIYDFANGAGSKTATEIVNELASSKLILPVMEQVVKSGVQLNNEQKQQVNAAIGNLGSEVEQNTIAKIRQMFGI